jgi:PAS domain S-box-containing protein
VTDTPLASLTRASALVAEGLTEEHLIPRLARCARDTAAADFCAVYLAAQPGLAERRAELSGGAEAADAFSRSYRLAGHSGGDPEILDALPATYGEGAGVLAPLFQARRELLEADLLDGAPSDAPLPAHFPARSLVGVPIRRRNGRLIGALLVGAVAAQAFDTPTIGVVRALGQLLGVGIDNARLIAAQQRERRMAAESAVTLGTVLESVGSGVCVVDLDGTLRLANKALRDLFGFTVRPTGATQEEVFASATVPPRDYEAFMARLRELVADPSQVDESEWELDTQAGAPRIVQRHAAPMRNLAGEVVGRVEVYTDVTEGRRLYTQLLNSEKLRAIGEMASGIAHDFNNLLASIVGQTELLHGDDVSPNTRQAIATIRQAALDGARMVRNLQGHARPRASQTPSAAADLNETAWLAAEMARPRWAGVALRGGGPIELNLELADPAGLPRVAIHPAELREVLLNLLFNAADAMPDGGRIDILTRSPAGSSSKYAEVEVRDTGQGMPESVRARIFEPFFSTKGPKGSGLGLAVAYSIITRHGGEITAESEVGKGTSFVIRLPLAPSAQSTGASADVSSAAASPPGVSSAAASAGEAPAERSQPMKPMAPTPPKPPAEPAPARFKGARILVVDDEPGLVAVVRSLMERAGATVQTADGGAAAQVILRQPGAEFDVVITDLDMPDVDGWGVAAEVKARVPRCKVVMLTGWAGEIAPEDSRSRGVDVLLAKPCSRAELESAVAQLLKPPPPPGGLHVLLVDDEPVFAGSLRDLLTLQGHQVTLVDSASAALSSVAVGSFDVVLTDYSLGDVTGAQLAEQLASRDGHLPFIILITGYATEVDDPALLTPGIQAVLPKPCRADDLRKVLARAKSS